jgi:Outer membrane protein beta-barrel domain
MTRSSVSFVLLNKTKKQIKMKKYLLAALLLAALTVNKKANAQQGFSLSVKATPQFSFLQNADDRDNAAINHKATFNGNFGIGAGYNFTPALGVGIDVVYSLQGQKYNFTGSESGKQIDQKVNYVKVPVYFTYTLNPDKAVSFIGKVGPQISFLTSSKLTDNNGNTIKSNTNDQYKDVTYGGMAAAGAQFKLEQKLFLTTMARFDYDLSNAENQNNSSIPAGRAKTHNMTAGLEIGLKYML